MIGDAHQYQSQYEHPTSTCKQSLMTFNTQPNIHNLRDPTDPPNMVSQCHPMTQTPIMQQYWSGGQNCSRRCSPYVEICQRRQIQPETYNGKSSLEDFIDQFELVSKWNQWTVDEKALQLAMSLRGMAKSAFKNTT